MPIYLVPTGDFVATTLNGALAAAADTATIGTGLTLPATNGVLQIDYDSTTAVGSDNGPETVTYATYTSGTGALTGLVRGAGGTTDVAHANGAKVQSGNSSVYMGDSQARLYSKCLSATRDLTAASGDVAYTGAGFTPTAVVAFAGNVGTTMSFGMCDSAKTERSTAQLSDGSSSADTSNLLQLSTGVGAQQTCTVKTFDSDGFTLTWTKTGSPTGTATIIFLCFR